MKTNAAISRAFLLAAFIGLCGILAGCSTGTESGDTNVEIGHEKDKDKKAGGDKNSESTQDNEPGADR